jgi:Common central domain of tyrosinase/Polyphenol oxidase middle domain
MDVKVTRRTLVKCGTAALAGAMSQTFIGIPALAAYAVGPTLRRNAFTMANNDPILVGYRRAITAMKALPANNPCSWTYQAAIHGTNATPVLTAWNTCHIDARYFWSWHRMYLYWFERIVRKHCGMYDWALPFWDWANPAQRQLPPAFRVAGSALFDASRNAALNDGTGSVSTGFGTSVTNAFTLLDYFAAQSGINGPHGGIHGAISGNMCCVTSAAQDPIFWLHHSNVDRQWNLWLAQGGGRSNPLSDADWRNHRFTFFDECCRQVTMTGCEVLRAAKQLSYAYEGEPPQVEQYCPLIWRPPFIKLVEIARFPKRWVLSKKPLRVPLAAAAASAETRSFAPRLMESVRARGQTAVLQLKGVEADAEPGAVWEVYVGPANLKPDPTGPYYVGTFGLFGGGIKTRKEHYHPGEFAFPISKAVNAAGGTAKLQVVFVPVSGVDVAGRALPAQARADVSVGEMSIVVDVAMPQPPKDEQDKLRREEQLE